MANDNNIIDMPSARKVLEIPTKTKADMLADAKKEQSYYADRIEKLGVELDRCQLILKLVNQQVAELDGTSNAVEDTQKYIAQMKAIAEPKKTKVQILSDLIENGQKEEAQILAELWSLPPAPLKETL